MPALQNQKVISAKDTSGGEVVYLTSRGLGGTS